MDTKTKAFLCSLLVFPGAGYFFLGKYVRGTISVVASLGVLCVVFVEIYHRTMVVAEKIARGAVPLDYFKIRSEIFASPGLFEPGLIINLCWAVAAIWIIASIDCYRIGSTLDTQ